MAKDVVCGMEVDNDSPYQSTYKDKTFKFCSENCKTKFDEKSNYHL